MHASAADIGRGARSLRQPGLGGGRCGGARRPVRNITAGRVGTMMRVCARFRRTAAPGRGVRRAPGSLTTSSPVHSHRHAAAAAAAASRAAKAKIDRAEAKGRARDEQLELLHAVRAYMADRQQATAGKAL